MFSLKKLNVALLTISSFCYSSAYAASGLVSLNDDELAKETGQALMSLSYIAPNDSQNLMGNSAGIGFYKLGLEATMDINVNIKKLQLGCGGVNNVSSGVGCDIDIDNLSLSGLGNSATSNTDSTADRNARASSDAQLINPFIQFAIKNPSTASTREVVGISLSAEKAFGLLTFGSTNSATPNGINSLSGYMQVAATTGTALVNGYGVATNSPADPARGTVNQSDGYNAINGKACCLLFGGGTLGFTTTSYALNLLDAATGSNILKGQLNLPQQAITGQRINTAVLYASAAVSPIALSGTINATAGGIVPLNNKSVSGTISNLTVDATINENLGLFHKASLNGTAASLSLQAQNIIWPGAKSVAQRGWWLEFSNPIDIGQINPTEKVDIPKSTLNAVMDQVSSYLNTNPVQCGNNLASDCLFGDAVPVGAVDLSGAPHASLILNNLQLAKQDFTPNCYGGLTFC